MSAIAGVYRLDDAPVSNTEVERMLGTMGARSPDGSEIWARASTGLGHGMLWTTPESLRERLPLASGDGNLVMTADARIDNRGELLATLGAHAPARDATDADYVLAAYEAWGEDCPKRLLGDFAFAIWDARAQRFFCARDHFGVRPFYYHQSARVFAFASEIKALLTVPGVPRSLNPIRVADYLGMVRDDRSSTFYEGIRRLPNGHWMTVGRRHVQIARYWGLDRERGVHLSSDAAYAETFRELLEAAVMRCTRSAYPLSALLSGGLDSSSIVCLASRRASDDAASQLNTYSAVFDELPECDERRFIEMVIARSGAKPHWVHADVLTAVGDLDEALKRHDEPFNYPILFMFRELCRTVAINGGRVMLDGFAADNIVSHGFGRLTELARSGSWVTLVRETRTISRFYFSKFHRPFPRLMWQYGIVPQAPRFARRAWAAVRGVPARWDPLVGPAFAHRVGLTEHVHLLTRDFTGSARSAREEHWRLHNNPGVYPNWIEIHDREAAANGIQPVYPFLDPHLAEFCLGIPAEQKLGGGWPRWVYRRATADLLPKEVCWRTDKSNLNPVLMRTMMVRDRELIGNMLREGAEVIDPYVNRAVLQAAWQNCLSEGYRGASSLRTMPDLLRVWRAITLSRWLKNSGLG